MHIEIDLNKVTENTRTIARHCAAQGVTVIGVTKSCCGMPEIAKALLVGGVGELADSRVSNLKRMRDAGIDASLSLLRSPALKEIAETVRLAETSFNSELVTMSALAQAARALGKMHRVILMVDVGDRREGVLPEDVAGIAARIDEIEGIQLVGLGSNIGCLSGLGPSERDTGLLVELADQVEETLGRKLVIVSGGSSIHLSLVEQGRLPGRINQLRVGQKILLGSDPGGTNCLAQTSQDAFTLVGEVIEVKWKPPLAGDSRQSMSGGAANGSKQAVQCRAILAMGTQDVRVEGLKPKLAGVKIIGATSDHLVLDVTARPTRVGDTLGFRLEYQALMSAMASPYVKKIVKERTTDGHAER
jgi:predicted amino acid racemase